MKVRFRYAERADIIRDGGSYLCVLRDFENQQHALLFQVVFHKARLAGTESLGPASHMQPKIFQNTVDGEDNATLISWEEASKILHSVTCEETPIRFLEMRAIAKEYSG